MIVLSQEFKSTSSKIYTFSFLCLAAKLLQISSITQAGVKLELANVELVSGAFAIVAMLLTISGVFRLLGDYVQTRVSDEVSQEEIVDLRPSDVIPAQGHKPTFSEARFGLIKFSATTSFAIEALLPLLVGGLISLYAAQDMVLFIKEITK